MSSSKNKFTLLKQNSIKDISVGFRSPCWCSWAPAWRLHTQVIQISINLCKTFLPISRIWNILLTWILARVFAYLPPFISQIVDFIYWTVLILFFYLFWMASHWKPAIAYSFLVVRTDFSREFIFTKFLKNFTSTSKKIFFKIL